MHVSNLELPGIKLIQLAPFFDDRGYFVEVYRESAYRQAGIDAPFVQDNHSYSQRGTIRGMHFQTKPGQAKLIVVITGTIYDVYVDIRVGSPTFGKWGSKLLDASKFEQLYIPNGFAHGFAVLSDSAHVLYKVSSLYHPETEKGFRYDDPTVGITWPIAEPIVSEKDRSAPRFKELFK